MLTHSQKRIRELNFKACFLWVLLLLASLIVLSCSSAPNSPETVVRDFVSHAVSAVEDRNRSDLFEMIYESYRDEEGRNKKDLVAFVYGYMMRNKSIYCFTLVDTVQLNEDDTISAIVIAAFAARPIANVSLLTEINSDIYRFEITLTPDGKNWKLVSASWRQALVDDFF